VTDPTVTLAPIRPEQGSVLRNLFELYAHDFSEQVPLELEPSGRFEIQVGEVWWTRSDHFPFFIRASEQLLGFALVRRGSRVTDATEVMDVAEFFVLRGARGKHVGTTAAHELFSAFPGLWEIRVRESNRAALSFWSRAAARWLGLPVTPSVFSSDGVSWNVLRLDSRRS
jgi:predicted acetyltransferase